MNSVIFCIDLSFAVWRLLLRFCAYKYFSPKSKKVCIYMNFLSAPVPIGLCAKHF